MVRYVVVSVILAACAGAAVGGGAVGDAGVPPPATGAEPTTTAPAPSTTATTATTLAAPTVITTTTTPPSPPVALISPAGIPVAILETKGLLHRVLTPCGNEGYLARGTPLYGVTVVLDPGHGGPVDTGAQGPNRLFEKDINFRVAQATAEELEARGVSAMLTRTGDYASPLFVRANLADSLGAELMLSIHHNAPTPRSSPRPGVEAFYQAESPQSRRLGGLVWEYAMNALSTFDIRWAASPDAGVLTVLNTRGSDAYGIIRHPETVTALVELGYISHRPEAGLFATPEYVTTIAGALADAISAYLETDDVGGGYVEEGRVFNPLPGVSQSVCIDPDLG